MPVNFFKLANIRTKAANGYGCTAGHRRLAFNEVVLIFTHHQEYEGKHKLLCPSSLRGE